MLQMIELNTIYNEDCLETMRRMPDGFVDLIVTDPPYGLNISKTGLVGGADSKTKLARLTQYTASDWDNSIPSKEIFDEIFRVSKNQVIFGGNYFVEYLRNSPCWIVWDKENGSTSFADCELAWTSFKTSVRIKRYRWNGMLQGDMKNKEKRYHPTQKPVAVMRWILSKYSTPEDLIYDPFMGSGTTARACKDLGRNYIGSEISKEYCEIAEKRLRQEVLL